MTSPSNRRAAWASNDDNTLFGLAIIVFGVATLGYVAWTTQHAEISEAFITAAHWHIQAIRMVSDRYDGMDARMLGADPSDVTAGQIVRAARAIGGFFRIPACLYLAVLAIACFVGAAPARFRRKLDLDGLIAEQARIFPALAAFVHRRLRLTAPARTGPRPSDPALHVQEWVALYAHDETSREFHPIGARVELSWQLGSIWRGVEQAAPHVRCLVAVFALHLARRREAALSLLGEMAESLPPGRDEDAAGCRQSLAFGEQVVARADAWLRDVEVASPARAMCSRHGFTAPALMTLLMAARVRGGVLAPAQFSMLKLVDRRLWYALHSLGFPTAGGGMDAHPNPRVEALGARDHWAAERAIGERLLTPAIDRAIDTIRAAVLDNPAHTGPVRP